MTTKYKETVTTDQVITEHYAARSITASNPYTGIPSLHFQEVKRLCVNGDLIKETPTGRDLNLTMGNPPVKIPYINENYEQILDAEGQPIDGYFFWDYQVMQILASLYIHAGSIADNAAPK